MKERKQEVGGIKMKGQREECHLVISGVRKLWGERKAHVE